jgi:hypothetical protein
MKRRDFIALTGLGAALAALPGFSASADEPKTKVLYYDYSAGFIHPPTVDNDGKLGVCGSFLKEFGEKNGIEVVCTKDGSVFDGDLSQYAAIVFYTSGDLFNKNDRCPGQPLSKQGAKNLFEAIRSGVGFLGFHSATDTWCVRGPERFKDVPKEERNDYINMIGGEFIMHGSQQEATVKPIDPELPCLKDMERPIRHHDEWYCNKHLAKDMHVFLMLQTEGMTGDCYNRPDFPCVWARKEGKGVVAYSALGHGNNHWETPLVQGVAGDLLKLVTGKLQIDLTPNFETVCPDAAISHR